MPSGKSESERQHDIRIVMAERQVLSETAQKLLDLMGVGYSLSREEANRQEADKLVIQISEHLGNISGFCDVGTRRAIFAAQRLLMLAIADSDGYGYTALKLMLPFLVGLTVDFNKRPFKIIGFDAKLLQTQVKAFLKR